MCDSRKLVAWLCEVEWSTSHCVFEGKRLISHTCDIIPAHSDSAAKADSCTIFPPSHAYTLSTRTAAFFVPCNSRATYPTSFNEGQHPLNNFAWHYFITKGQAPIELIQTWCEVVPNKVPKNELNALSHYRSHWHRILIYIPRHSTARASLVHPEGN